jgi:subtilisin family serine protease
VPPFSARQGGNFLNRGIGVVAPGVGVVSLGVPGSYVNDSYPSARLGNGYLRGGGTSQATLNTLAGGKVVWDADGSLQRRGLARVRVRRGHQDLGGQDVERKDLVERGVDRRRVVLGELAQPGGHLPGFRAVMDAQVAHLRGLAARPEIEVRVVPLADTLHPGTNGTFAIMDFPQEKDPSVIYVETYDAARYPEKPEQVARFRARFEALRAVAVPLEEFEL